MIQTNNRLVDTGERMMPESSGMQTFWEHIYRYRFASRTVRGRRVLDVACGEGYGTAALAKAGAASVVGVDISPDACEHARLKYGVDARAASAENLPFGDKSFETVISFETIEHLENPSRLADECRRLLTDDGTLVISTPNKPVYKKYTPANHFHPSEMDESEFLGILTPRFKNVRLYSQSIDTAYWWTLRSLCALRTPWVRVRGFWKLRMTIAKRLFDDYDQAARPEPVSTIVSNDHRLSWLVNPYELRKRSKISGERPTYFVAVATPRDAAQR